MADADVPKQLLHMSLEEDIRYESVPFAEIEFLVLFRNDTCRILSTVLKDGEAIIQCLVHIRTKSSNDADDAAHVSPFVADSRAAFVFLPPEFA